MSSKLLQAVTASALMLLSLGQASAQEPEILINHVNPDADFSSYNHFIILPLDLHGTRLIPPPWVEGQAGKPRRWTLSEKNASFLQEQYYAAMKAELEDEGGFGLVEDPAADAMELEIEVISLTPYASPKEQVITKGSGEMTIRAELRDSMSGDILVIYEGDTAVGEDYQELTEFTVDQNVDQLFRGWGAYLREALAEEKARPSKQ